VTFLFQNHPIPLQPFVTDSSIETDGGNRRTTFRAERSRTATRMSLNHRLARLKAFLETAL
jgi:hypothetical protein